MERIVLVPRWGGDANSDWYPWLAAEIGLPIAVASLRPMPAAPTIEACVAELTQVAAGDLSETLFVGHSVGCQAILRFLATRDGTVGGLLAVAGWFSIDDSWPSIRPWIDTPIATERVRAVCPTARLLLSDNDPFTADHHATAAQWRHRLGATVGVVPGGRHFNRSEEPAVLAAVKDLTATALLGDGCTE